LPLVRVWRRVVVCVAGSLGLGVVVLLLYTRG
jgi:hypothetical protein